MRRGNVRPSSGREREVREERKSKTGKTRKSKMIRYNSEASMKPSCMYCTVFREDIEPWGLCPVKMMSYADLFF